MSTLEGATVAEPAPGFVLLSRYVLEAIVGRGSASAVFRARDSQSPHAALSLAVKVLLAPAPAQLTARARLAHAHQQMQRLAHPGIVRVLDFERDAPFCFMSMELVRGRTLSSWLQAPCSHARALQVINDIGAALEHAHSLGIVHGDLKPTNVMVSDDGTVKLLDFGSAPLPSGNAPAHAPLYASPQALGGAVVECRDDIFSLACLSYYILSKGRHPYGGRPSLENSRAKSPPTYCRAIPDDLFAVIRRGLSAEPAGRPASVGEFLNEVQAAGQRHGVADAHASAENPGAAMLARSAPSVARKAALLSAATAHSMRAMALAIVLVAGLGLSRLGLIHQAAVTPASRSRSAAMIPPFLAPVASRAPSAPRQEEARPTTQDPGIISFESATIHASAAQRLVAITVTRSHSTSRSTAFMWRVERGTAHPGIDYEQMGPQIGKLIAGQAVRTLFIPLMDAPAGAMPRQDRTFTVELKQLPGGPALGRYARVTVDIAAPVPSSQIAAYRARSAQP